MIDQKNPAFNSYALAFNNVQEKMPRARLDRPRELVFEERPCVEILEEGVRLYYYAPDAERVEAAIAGESVRRPMTPAAEKGYWTVEITDKPGGMYFYDVYVNDVMALDPRGNIIYSTRATNCFEIPEKGFDTYLMKNVPHGAIQMRYFYSENSKSMRSVLVYTPAGYDGGTQRYPVLYLQHGGGESESAWIWAGRANFILDNLIAEGKCQPMLVVMNDGYVLAHDGGTVSSGSIGKMIREDCVPFIDREFRTIADREHRAAAGLSQGGLHARCMAFENPDLFANLGMFSSGVGFEVDSCDIWGERHDYRELFKTPDHYASLFRVTFITCGTEDPRNAYTKPQVETLQKQGFPIRYASYPGQHEWQVWRKSLSDFLPLLFR